MEIGSKIKDLRLSHNLTQEELANRCELTKGYISQLENDLTSPAITTLIDILSALGTNLKEFFSNDDENEKVVFGLEDYFEKEQSGYTLSWLVPNAQKNDMEPVMVCLNAKSQTEEDYPHEGEEFGFVVEGEVVVVIGKKQHVCKKGESFYFSSAKIHYLKNIKNKRAVIVWVSSPPNF